MFEKYTVRRLDAHELNAFANQPGIPDAIMPGMDWVDLTGVLNVKGNVAYALGDVCMLFLSDGRGSYEAHYLIPAEARGAAAVVACKEILTKVFTTWSARGIYGHTPRDFRAARVMNRRLGAVPVGTTVDQAGRPCVTYALTREKWAQS